MWSVCSPIAPSACVLLGATESYALEVPCEESTACIYCATDFCYTTLERSEPAAALDVLEHCACRAREGGDRWNKAACYPLIGQALLLLGRADEAEANLDRGLKVLAELGLRYPEAEALLFLARLRMDHARHHEAGVLLHRALRIARETGSNALRYRSHLALAELHER